LSSVKLSRDLSPSSRPMPDCSYQPNGLPDIDRLGHGLTSQRFREGWHLASYYTYAYNFVC
jgi:hypothetical protein